MKKPLIVILVALAGVALTAGIVQAASLTVDSLTVGKQGSGGVTYFNGTIINNTKGTGNADNPITIGDNVRIDGTVYRGATAGTSDSQPFKINDNLEVAGTIKMNGTSPVVGSKIYTGTIDLTQDGDEVVTTADGTCYGPTTIKNYSFHYKKVTVPEITVSSLPEVRLYTKPPSSSTPTIIPNNNDVWGSAGYVYFSEGTVYLAYKVLYNYCDGTSSPSFNFMSSDPYQLVVYKK